MRLPKRKVELDEFSEFTEWISELRGLGMSADRLEAMSQHLYDRLNEARVQAEGIVETVREPLLILDKDIRIVTANPAFYRLFQLKPASAEGRILYELNGKQWNIPSLRELLEDIIPKNTQFNDYEFTHAFPRIGKRLFLLNARMIQQYSGRENLILLAMEDITEKRTAEDEKNQLISKLQSTLEKMRMLLPTCDNCKRVQDSRGHWVQVEEYIKEHSEEAYSHGLCPDCDRKLHSGEKK